MIAKTFPRNQILIATRKDQVQHSAIEHTVFWKILVMHEIKIYTRENKSSKTCEYQPDKLDDHLIENNHEECSPPTKKKKKKKVKKKI